MPMQEAMFLEICLICTFQVRFSSIYTPGDFVHSTCFIELLSIEKDGSLLKVFNLFLKPININSVFDLLRVSLFADKHSVILIRSLFIFSSRNAISLLAKVKWVSSAYILGCESTRQFGTSFTHSVGKTPDTIDLSKIANRELVTRSAHSWRGHAEIFRSLDF